jgi:hypothetical protein
MRLERAALSTTWMIDERVVRDERPVGPDQRDHPAL